MTTGDRNRQADAVFMRALALPSKERDHFVNQACGDDYGLRRTVKGLLLADQQAGEFLARPLGRVPSAPGIGDRRPEPAGRRVGEFRLVRPIGHGGMATVYAAEHAQRPEAPLVAIKILHADWVGSTVARRFDIERRILARLDHPSLPHLLGSGYMQDGPMRDDRPYVVMPWVDGSPLDRYCRRYRPALDQRLDLFDRVCLAVAALHRRGIVHCDLKPANVMVDRCGRPTVIDFGIATLLDPKRFGVERPASRGPLRLLTVRYASPEQRYDRRITPATDVHALGTMLAEILDARANGGHPDPTAATRWTGPCPREPHLAAIVRRARHPDPARRYTSVMKLALDLRRYRRTRHAPRRALDRQRRVPLLPRNVTPTHPATARAESSQSISLQ